MRNPEDDDAGSEWFFDLDFLVWFQMLNHCELCPDGEIAGNGCFDVDF